MKPYKLQKYDAQLAEWVDVPSSEFYDECQKEIPIDDWFSYRIRFKKQTTDEKEAKAMDILHKLSFELGLLGIEVHMYEGIFVPGKITFQFFAGCPDINNFPVGFICCDELCEDAMREVLIEIIKKLRKRILSNNNTSFALEEDISVCLLHGDLKLPFLEKKNNV